MLTTLKAGAIVGGAYAAGKIGGAKLADMANVTNEAARGALKVGTGVVAFFIISAVLS